MLFSIKKNMQTLNIVNFRVCSARVKQALNIYLNLQIIYIQPEPRNYKL